MFIYIIRFWYEYSNIFLIIIICIRYAITEAVKHWKNIETLQRDERIKSLKDDLFNGPFHVFGDHGKCARYILNQ